MKKMKMKKINYNSYYYNILYKIYIFNYIKFYTKSLIRCLIR